MTDQPADQDTPVQVLQRAIQKFVNDTSDEAGLVTGGLVAWESVTYTDDGRPLFEVDFASVGGNESLTAALGLMAYAKAKLLNDLVAGTDEDGVG